MAAIRARKLVLPGKGAARQKSAPATPVRLTDETFWSVIQGAPVALVDFWAAWCGPWQRTAASGEALARDYAGRLTVGKLNVDEKTQSAASFNVQSIPTLLVFCGEELLDRVIGAVPRDVLERLVQRWF